MLFLHFREVPTHLVCLLCLVFKGQYRLSRQLLYTIIGVFLCQQLFKIYFKFLFFRNRFKCERSLTVFIIYHSFLFFASLFSNFFYIFGNNFFRYFSSFTKILILKLFSYLLLFLRGVYYICKAEIAQLVEQRTRNA